MSWVRIPPRAALLFFLEKRAVLGVVDFFVVPLPESFHMHCTLMRSGGQGHACFFA